MTETAGRVSPERLRASLRWVMTEWLDATEDGEHIPAHLCWFITKPDAGYCPFHEEWFGAAEDCGLLEDWAKADMEDQPVSESPA